MLADEAGTVPFLSHLQCFPDQILSLLSGAESASSLLVHLGTGGYSVHCQEHHSLGLDDAEQCLR